MIKLDVANIDNEAVLKDCSNNIKGQLKQNLLDSTVALLSSYQEYELNASQQNLHLLPTNDSKCTNKIIGKLSHKDLTSLYTNHFVPIGKPCRRYYSEILAITNDCPYCSGIGETRTLDHYLIKAKFPTYSIFSKNLIPCCADCNGSSVGKGQRVAKTQEEQHIHPYFDKDIFFNEQWVFAVYNHNRNGGFFIYEARPPENWNDIDKRRAINHFKSFDLITRFSRLANNELSGIQKQIDMISNTTENMIRVVLEPFTSNELGVNHWKKLMCLALIDYYRSL